MDNTKQNFNIRKDEIEHYFEFLLIFDDDDTRLHYKKSDMTISEKIQPKFQVILIANAFIILYNLIESTVRNSIIEIYTKIKDENITFDKLSENLQKIWFKQYTDNLRENNFQHETLRKYVLDLAKDIVNKETIKLSKKNIDFSGNLDAEKIRNLAKDIGFEEISDGRNLTLIKDKRNRLAHGEQTFYEAGKDFSVKELTEFKEEAFNYLSDVINNIEAFIFAKEYTNN